MKRVLIIDDERNVRLAYRVALETDGYVVEEARDGESGLDLLREKHFGAVILDLRMPGADGIAVLRSMRERNDKTPVVMITAYGDVPQAVEAMKLGAIDFLAKPIHPDDLRRQIAEMLLRHSKSPDDPAEADTFDAHFRQAKLLINLQLFGEAWEHLSRSLELQPQSSEALNLAGVLFEMKADLGRARKLYGKAIKHNPSYEPAQQNMRRMFELHHFGSSDEPIALGE